MGLAWQSSQQVEVDKFLWEALCHKNDQDVVEDGGSNNNNNNNRIDVKDKEEAKNNNNNNSNIKEQMVS